MKIEIEYVLNERVEIIPLERIGRVASIWITEHGIKYEIRYFDNATAQSTYFFSDELRNKTNKEELDQ
ncbi:MAG: hypothetical protein ABIJ40_00455 [Bacteroidota bacterium]